GLTRSSIRLNPFRCQMNYKLGATPEPSVIRRNAPNIEARRSPRVGRPRPRQGLAYREVSGTRARSALGIAVEDGAQLVRHDDDPPALLDDRASQRQLPQTYADFGAR